MQTLKQLVNITAVSSFVFAIVFMPYGALAERHDDSQDNWRKDSHERFDEDRDEAKNNFQAYPPFHIKSDRLTNNAVPQGMSPSKIRTAYNLPSSGGAGKTIAIIDAYDNPNAQNDLNIFSSQYGLPSCTTANGCFEKHMMANRISKNSGWILESDLDIQWAHAIAPQAKILLVEAKSSSGNDLLNAVNYARNRADVVAVSMSWGGSEFSSEPNYDYYFTSPYGATFFASSGDSGNGVIWPAVSKNVVAVGGTTLNLDASGNVLSETAWSGSGGGVSVYELEPAFQTTYNVPGANGKRAVPDVAYNANPNTGVSVYDSYGYGGQSGWFVIGGTSAGAPQWAAIRALGASVANNNFYIDAASAGYSTFFRDIVSGTNGACGFYCTATTSYDYVTGLGSPLMISF